MISVRFQGKPFSITISQVYAPTSNAEEAERFYKVKLKVTQSCLTLCNPINRPWNSPDQNTGVGSLSLLQGIFPTHGSNPGLPYCRQILYQLSHKGSLLQYWIPYPSPRDLPHPEIEPGSSALQVDSLPTELSGKPSHGNAQRRIDPNIPLKQKHSVLPKFKSSPLALIYIIL